MSTEYPVYNNKPIDQWKVTELKEELRRRKLKINGLKEELVRRLDESLRSEMTSDPEEELGNGTDSDNDPQNNVDGKDSDLPPVEKNAEHDEDQSKKVDDDDAMVDVNNNTSDVHHGAKDDCQKETTDATTDVAFEATSDNTVPVQSVTDDQNAVTQLQSNNQEASYDEKSKESKPPAEDVEFTPSETANQVSEVNPDLGFQVKCESISTDSVLINEKNPKLKDNLNANNVHLEVEVVKTDMVQPSSGDVPTIGVDLHPLKDDKELVDNQGSLEEVGDVTCTMRVEQCKKTDSVDVGSAEKLNFDSSSGDEPMPIIGVDLHPLEDDKMLVDKKGSLEEVGNATCTMEGEHRKKTSSVDVRSPEKLNFDRSSGDESMEEDVLESRQVESKNYSELGERNEDSKAKVVQVVTPVDAMMDGFPPEKKDMVPEDGIKPIAPVEKRKAKDQETVDMIEPKRQRRLNLETVKAPEAQTSHITATTPKDVFQPSLRRSLSRTETSISAEAPKERVVPPPLGAATTSLRINNFLRPFTLKAVQELLGKTGTFSDFWMDHIKTHCYVTYPSLEEAVATRNALYNLQWPSNGGRFLTAEFVDPHEVKTRLEAPQSPAPVTSSPNIPTASAFQPQTQAMQPPRHPLWQQLPPPPPLPPPPALSNPLLVRERLPPPPPPPKKPEPSIVTLDDLFKKTIARPRIYYLPLSEEQVAARLVDQGKIAQEGHQIGAEKVSCKLAWICIQEGNIIAGLRLPNWSSTELLRLHAFG
ncbi:apoptotic chromatin condensation inducer in the nucleus [Iris pallida]|uniref:Apoptotic chromatin condensation inducer in the nucleus n=1 Tax=Iris pallida TaxID=29817 RepID=A0AAX6ECS1_IRIPA|nr:apoptotic chromatin condensation inducer in the nucleus [Iris pallida]